MILPAPGDVIKIFPYLYIVLCLFIQTVNGRFVKFLSFIRLNSTYGMISHVTLTLVAALAHIAAFAQIAKPDTVFLGAATQYQQSFYTAAIGGQSRLYNGTEHRDYLSRDEETPYFGLDDWQYGYIIYDDERYDSVAMFYDLSTDQVITEHKLSGAKIELIAKKISAFELNGHSFERLQKDSAGVIGEGFYQRLYGGPTRVYVRRNRTLTSRASGNELVYSFEERNRIYLRKDNLYYPVKSKRSVLQVLDDKRPELKAVLKREKLKFRLDRELAIVRMAATYDTSKK